MNTSSSFSENLNFSLLLGSVPLGGGTGELFSPDGLAHTNFHRAFSDGLQIQTDSDTIHVSIHRAPDLQLSSGRIHVACPDLAFYATCLDRTVEPGTYPVYLSSARGCVAAAVIIFSDGGIDRWEQASHDIPDSSERAKYSHFEPGKWIAFRESDGWSCVMDLDVANSRRAENVYGFKVKTEKIPQAALEWRPKGKKSGPNVVVIKAGWGSGEFHHFWGLDAKGIPVCLALDFRVLIGQKRETEIIPNILGSKAIDATTSKLRQAGITVQVSPQHSDGSIAVRFSGPFLDSYLCDCDQGKIPTSSTITGDAEFFYRTFEPVETGRPFDQRICLAVSYLGDVQGL